METSQGIHSNAPNFQVLFESAPGNFLVLDPQFKIIAVTEGYLQATMTLRHQVIGRALFEVFPDNPDEPEATGTKNLRASLDRVLQLRKPDTMAVQKYDIRQPDGVFQERYWSPVNSPIFGSDHEILYIIHKVEDVSEFVRLKSKAKEQDKITEQLKTRTVHIESEIYNRAQELQETNKALRKSEERFRLLVDAVRDYAILNLDREGRITSWNPGAERITGFRAEEVMGKPTSIFYSPESLRENKAELELKAAVSLGRFEDEAWRVRRDGTQYWANVIVTPIFDSSGRISGFAKIIQDLTLRKQNEDQLKKIADEVLAQARTLKIINAELESFSYSVSHDLRAPLRSIVGFSNAILEDFSGQIEPGVREYLERIFRAAQKMGQLIDGLLSLSRLSRQTFSMVKVDLSQMAQEILDELKINNPERNVNFAIEPGIQAEGDRNLLLAVMGNLLGNAWKFTGKRADARIEFGKKAKNGRQVFFVRDNGAGFDMRYVDKLFGAFQRLHGMNEFEGTGIGLATVQRIIQRHGGEIWVESATPGEGAEFQFTI